MGTDYAWCFDNPHEAAAYIDDLQEQLATVTAERDELATALKDQIDLGDGDVAVTARDALAKLGADKTGEK